MKWHLIYSYRLSCDTEYKNNKQEYTHDSPVLNNIKQTKEIWT